MGQDKGGGGYKLRQELGWLVGGSGELLAQINFESSPSSLHLCLHHPFVFGGGGGFEGGIGYRVCKSFSHPMVPHRQRVPGASSAHEAIGTATADADGWVKRWRGRGGTGGRLRPKGLCTKNSP